MTDEERVQKLAEFESRFDAAFVDGNPDVMSVQGIISDLLMIPESARPFFRAFAITVSNRLFLTGASLPGLDVSLFEDTQNGSQSTRSLEEEQIDEAAAISSPETPDEWFAVFRRMYSSLADDIETLKG